MVNTLNASFGAFLSFINTTQFWTIMGAGLTTSDQFALVETDVQVIFRSPGTLSNMWVRLSTNSTSSITITSRKNAAAGSQTISVGASATGTFTDSSHTDTVAAGDKIGMRTVPAATGNFTMTINAFTFAATTDTVRRLTCASFNTNFASQAGPFFFMLDGTSDSNSTPITEAHDKIRQRKAGTIKNAAVYVANNNQAVVNTVTGRKNGANGNISISITANGSGFFEDTTHSDSVVAGDDYCWQMSHTGTPAGSPTLSTFQADFVSTAGDSEMVCSRDETLAAIGPTVTTYYALGGDLASTSTTEADTQLLANSPFSFSELTVNLVTNTISATSTVTLRKGAADTALVASITSNTSGIFSDSTHTVTVLSTDLVNTKLVTGGTGTSLTPSFIAIWSNLAVGGGGAIIAGQINSAFGYPLMYPTIWHGSTGMINFGR